MSPKKKQKPKQRKPTGMSGSQLFTDLILGRHIWPDQVEVLIDEARYGGHPNAASYRARHWVIKHLQFSRPHVAVHFARVAHWLAKTRLEEGEEAFERRCDLLRTIAASVKEGFNGSERPPP